MQAILVLFPFISLVSTVSLAGDSVPLLAPTPRPPIILESHERLITLLQTNDIHGGVEPTVRRDGTQVGGMAAWAGAVRSIEQGLLQRYGSRVGVLKVDGGDQTQGTLISNRNEGQLVFATMNEVGYDAVVPGNHDYDFGPIGWLEDKVTPQTSDQNPRGSLLRLVGQAKFPLVSANTYLKNSLLSPEGNTVPVRGVGCRPLRSSKAIQWTRARRPEFLRPYVVKEVAGVRVALIGMDHPGTPESTTPENVSDLCFRDEVETYREIHAELQALPEDKRPQIYVLVVHNGDTDRENSISEVVEALTHSQEGKLVDAVASAHTHFIRGNWVNEVPIIQSGAGGQYFGRIDLVWDDREKKVVRSKTRSYAGIPISLTACAPASVDFCSQQSAGQPPAFEGVPIQNSQGVQDLINAARREIQAEARRVLGTAEQALTRDRISESPLANAMTDILLAVAREQTRAQIAFLNTGGIRAEIDSGEITYEDFFKVLPFNNRGLVIGPMSAARILTLLERSVRTCGQYGALMQSGLRVTFERDCDRPGGGTDPNARLIHVETVPQEAGTAPVVLLDTSAGIRLGETPVFNVATVDFLAAGGSGYHSFAGTPVVRELGIVRESMADYLFQRKPRLNPLLDGRWRQVNGN